jgi:hypothetical protein
MTHSLFTHQPTARSTILRYMKMQQTVLQPWHVLYTKHQSCFWLSLVMHSRGIICLEFTQRHQAPDLAALLYVSSQHTDLFCSLLYCLIVLLTVLLTVLPSLCSIPIPILPGRCKPAELDQSKHLCMGNSNSRRYKRLAITCCAMLYSFV